MPTSRKCNVLPYTVNLMKTVDDIRARLAEVEVAIRDGQVGSTPQEFIEGVHNEVQAQAPAELQGEVYDRLLELKGLLGIRDSSVAEERLASPQWDMFLAALEELPDATEDEAAFWRSIDAAKAPLFDGCTGECGAEIEAAVQAELNQRGLAAPSDFEP